MLSVCNVSPGTHWMTLVDPKFISLTKLERESKTKMREFLDPRVANITSGGHKQKGLNLLSFNFLTSVWSLASW